MLDVTDAHFRALCRLLSTHAVLWTEMVVDSTVLHCDERKLRRYLDFPLPQHPLVLQLGGSQPAQLAAAARTAAGYGYSELNLNCGCPSPKVAGAGCFGATLMTEPLRVAEACAAMRAASGLPVTVKCRTGVDDADSYEELCAFVAAVAGGGVSHFVVHARKALLNGLSPADNRRVPPLLYHRVLALTRDFPHLRFTLNGGLASAAHAAAALRLALPGASRPALAGAMLGRAVWDRPWDVLADVDRGIYGCEANPARSRRAVLAAYAAYADEAQGSGRFGRDAKSGAPYPTTRMLVRPLLNLFAGVKNGGRWRTELDGALLRDDGSRRGDGAVAAVLAAAAHVLSEEVLDAPPAAFAAGREVLVHEELPPPLRALQTQGA
jgi:tRNA-dihydrouridine synthase A